jgi:hypothetical protein
MSDVGPGKQFASDWHRTRFIEDCERGLRGALTRGADDEVQGYREMLAWLGVGAEAPVKRAQKRPAAAKREKRA